MSSIRNSAPIRIGLVSDETIRLAGLFSVFDQPAREGHKQLLPVACNLADVLNGSTLECLVMALHASSGGLETLNAVRRLRPTLRMIVIGPEGNDELVMDSIIGGVRGYLDWTVGSDTLLEAIEVVNGGSIWAPRRLLSKLIDRLLKADTSPVNAKPHLTDRERQVLELILKAHSNREIARQLGIEERTVKAHVGRLMRKAGADNRIELSMRALHRPAGRLAQIQDWVTRCGTSPARYQ